VQNVEFDWPKALRKRYVQLREDFEFELDDGTSFTTKWAMGKANKLHQLCQGFMYINQYDPEAMERVIGREVHNFHNLKYDWLQEELPYILKRGPVLIWSYLQEPLFRCQEMIRDKLKMDCGLIIGGKGTDKQSEKAEMDFKSGKTDILVLSQAKAARGLDLWRAATAIFFCRNFSTELNENAAKRCYRSGSEIHDKILYINLMMKKSTDTAIKKAILEKLSISDAILNHLNQKEI